MRVDDGYGFRSTDRRQTQANASSSSSSMESLLRELIYKNDVMLQSQATAIRNLEVQLGQIADELKNEMQGALLSTNEVARGNMKEQCQDLTLIRGKTNPTVAQNQGTQGNLQPVNAPTMSQPMESTIHNVNQPSSSTESQEENRERRERATQAEPASVCKDTIPGRVLIDVQEGISTNHVGDQQVKFDVVNALKDPDDFHS